jgi:hypothetical protein
VLHRGEQEPRAPRGNSDWIRMPRQLERRHHPKPGSAAINRRPHSLFLEPGRSDMAKQLSNFSIGWAYVHPPERSARLLPSEARRMLAKLEKLHQSFHLRPVRNRGATRGSTCLDRPCEQRPEAILEITVLHRQRPEVRLAQFGILWEHPSKIWGTTGNLLGLE